MPNEVFFRVLGLPFSGDGDGADLMRWVHELKDRAPDDIRLTPVAKQATRGIQDYFVRLLQDRRRHPRNDLVSHLGGPTSTASPSPTPTSGPRRRSWA